MTSAPRVVRPSNESRASRFRLGPVDVDPRFATLHDLPEFRSLVAAHLGEPARQRDAYLSWTVAEASGHDL